MVSIADTLFDFILPNASISFRILLRRRGLTGMEGADEARLRERVRENLRRRYYPEGPTRRLSAVLADGDRRAMLGSTVAPTLVL